MRVVLKPMGSHFATVSCLKRQGDRMLRELREEGVLTMREGLMKYRYDEKGMLHITADPEDRQEPHIKWGPPLPPRPITPREQAILDAIERNRRLKDHEEIAKDAAKQHRKPAARKDGVVIKPDAWRRYATMVDKPDIVVRLRRKPFAFAARGGCGRD